MRSLTRSEILLLTLCSLAILGMGNLILHKQHKTKLKKVEGVLADLQLRRSNPNITQDASTPSEQAKVWEDRMAWLDANMPKMTNKDQEQAKLLEKLRESALDYGLDIDGQSFVKPGGSQYYKEVAVKINLDGPERKVFQWLSEIQSSEKFLAIKFIKLDPALTSPTLECDCNIIVAQWFKP